jgi:valyl-tRNA synthetase
VTGRLYTFRYVLEGGGEIHVATTRPETILADTAVAVHPDDPRYTELVGRTARVPILDRRVPVIADTYVDREFGTGALKITPGHDPNDYEIGKRHGLPEINILEPDGTLNENAGPYAGLDRTAARARLWDDMRTAGLVVGEVEHVHQVGHCQRCHTVVEPLLSTQWFVRMAPLAEDAMAAVRAGEVRIVPERFTREFFRWMENIRDWVISRQLWWGHRIPVWYGPDGTMFAARDDAGAQSAAREHFGQDVKLTQDEDVLDTWFSSGLWPFSTLGWPEETEDLERYYPADVLETGYDILFFWVARMIVMGQAMTGRVPFHTVYLHGLVRDPAGRKMSKSLGNAIDPLETIEQYGCDALRFSLLTGSTPGMDMKLVPERLEGGRNFGNKLWNIGRFALSVLPDGFAPEDIDVLERRMGAGDFTLADRWILSRFNRVVAEATRLMEAFQVGEAGRELYEFAWGELADWYVESAKLTLFEESPRAEATRQVLYNVLERTLALLHPFMPFVTEAVWGHLPRRASDAPALIVSTWPTAGARDQAAEDAFALIQELVGGIRNVRAEYDVEPGRRVAAVVSLGASAVVPVEAATLLAGLARLDASALEIGHTTQPPTEAYATVVAAEGVEAWLPLAGLVDLERERARLEAGVAAAAAEVERLEAVLANASFTDRAPADVVQRERDRLDEARVRRAALAERLGAIAG